MLCALSRRATLASRTVVRPMSSTVDAEPEVLATVQGKAGYLTLNRPKVQIRLRLRLEFSFSNKLLARTRAQRNFYLMAAIFQLFNF